MYLENLKKLPSPATGRKNRKYRLFLYPAAALVAMVVIVLYMMPIHKAEYNLSTDRVNVLQIKSKQDLERTLERAQILKKDRDGGKINLPELVERLQQLQDQQIEFIEFGDRNLAGGVKRFRVAALADRLPEFSDKATFISPEVLENYLEKGVWL